MSLQLPEGHLGRREAISLITLVILTSVFLSLPQRLVRDGYNASWMVVLLAGILSLVGLWFILALTRRFPGLTIVEAGTEAAGPVLGTIAALGYFLFFMASLVLFLRQFTETIITALLPQTPISVITVAFLIVITYACYIGLEAISRTAGLFIFFILGSLLLIIFLLLPTLDAPYSLFPLWGSGIDKIARSGAAKTSLFGDILLIGLIAPMIRNREVRRIGYTSLVLAAAMMVFIQLYYLLVFPVPVAAKLTFPLYTGARLVFIGRFFQRVDALFVFVWILSGLIKMSASLYAASVILARTYRLPAYRPLLFPLGILSFAFSLAIPSFPDAVTIDSAVLRSYGWIPTFLVPALIYLTAVLRHKGGVRRETPENNS